MKRYTVLLMFKIENFFMQRQRNRERGTERPFFIVTSNKTMIMVGLSFRFPAFQLRNSSGEEPSDDLRELHLDELHLAEFLHFPGSLEVVGELAVLVTVAAIHRRFRAVDFGTASLRVVFERHGTALTDFVHLLFHGGIQSQCLISVSFFEQTSRSVPENRLKSLTTRCMVFRKN